MKLRTTWIAVAVVLLHGGDPDPGAAQAATAASGSVAHPSRKLLPPPQGHLYHGVYPGDSAVREHEISEITLSRHLTALGNGRDVAWVYFTEEWYDSLEFPHATAAWIKARGSIPFIRMTPRSTWEIENLGECVPSESTPEYPLQSIIDGAHDAALGRWMKAARDFGLPILVEFGTEMNGCWFPWNGKYNGGGVTNRYGDCRCPDGPERFRDAYRRIVQIARDSGATNITWVFHVTAGDDPSDDWNRFENYYPGPEWVDWLAVSVYGPQAAGEPWTPFRDSFKPVYDRLVDMDTTSPHKPIVVAEFGARADDADPGAQGTWASEAISYLLGNHAPRVIGFSWWNSAWGDGAVDMRVHANPSLAQSLRERLSSRAVLDRPILPR